MHPSITLDQFRLSAHLVLQLTKRDILQRYKGSFLGILWSLLTPLLMLSVYTFVFGAVFQAKWDLPQGDGSILEFSLILFSGLIVFQLFADIVSTSPTLIVSNPNYVTKLVFPIEILSVVRLLSGLFHFGVSLIVLLLFLLIEFGAIPPTAVLLPLVIGIFSVFLLGVSWALCALGVYLRDLGQVVTPIVTALLFLAPIFFPIASMPDWIRPWIALNPLTLPVNMVREVLVYGTFPDLADLALYAIMASLSAVLGFLVFKSVRRGFADVL